MIELLISILMALSSVEAQPHTQPEPEPVSACVWAKGARVAWHNFNRGYYDSGLYDWHNGDGIDNLDDPNVVAEYANVVGAYTIYIVTFGDEWEALGGHDDVMEVWLDGLDAATLQAGGMTLMRQGLIESDVDIYNAGIEKFNRGITAENEMLDGLNLLRDECRQNESDTSA